MILPDLLRTLAADPATDADLLARYRAGRDAAAFAELVRRHGRLVWAACRHQTRCPADADDAFQAVWLALAARPAAVRQPERLPAWLHAVAGRACGRLRRANDRRRGREAAAAVPEASTPPPAWDRALAALHEEVDRLPPAERAAFVLCGLEGVGATEAAARLGWKLGTLSGRLTRAKQRLEGRLTARDLAVGAAVACAGPVPAAAAATAVGWASGAAAPRAILSLSRGAVMGTLRLRLAAAGLVLAGGLGAGVGGWAVQAQPPANTPPPTGAAPKQKPAGKWEFLYHQLAADQHLTPAEFEGLYENYEGKGFGFAGSVPLQGADGKRGPALVFYRPRPAEPATVTPEQAALLTAQKSLLNFREFYVPVDDAAALKARIAALEKELATARGQQVAVNEYLSSALVRKLTRPLEPSALDLRLTKSQLPLTEPVAVVNLINALADARPAGTALLRARVDGDGVLVSGDAAGKQWLLGVLKAVSPPAAK